MPNGYMGKGFWVDLSTRTWEVQELGDELIQEYMTGYGLAAKLIFDRMPAGADPLGPENVLAVMMPYKTSNPDSEGDARAVLESTGVRGKLVDISAMVDGHLDQEAVEDRMRRGNVMARARMIVLYDHSAAEGALVIGTSNKTEALLGYSTQFGDAASALNPLGDLYKHQVYQLAASPNWVE